MRATGTLVLVLAWLFAMPLTAEVYKVVDEDGNITYTDRPPDPEAAPLDLPALNEVGKREASPEEEAAPMPVEAVELPDDPSIHKLRREYRDFRIIHPVDGFTFRGGSNPATVAWGTDAPLREGMYVVFSIDGRKGRPTRRQVVSTGVLKRGEHTVTAELRDPQGRRVANAEPVRFNIHRQYQWFSWPRD